MDKRKRNEGSGKKDKDRGELIKIIDKVIKKNHETLQKYPEGGDSDEKVLSNQKLEKMRINILVKKPTEREGKHINDENRKNTNMNRYGQDKSHPDVQLRKRIRDKYTLKLKSSANKSDHTNVVKKPERENGIGNCNSSGNGSNIKVINVVSEDCKPVVEQAEKQLAEETTQTRPSAPSSAKTEILDRKIDKNPSKQDKNSAKTDKSKPERNSAKKKPMIKTIMCKNGSVKIYKAVTFVEPKRKLTPLEIKIPVDGARKQKVSKYTDTNSLKFKPRPSSSRCSIKEKSVPVKKKIDKRRDRKFRYVPSPDGSMKDSQSPPTEVARWAPASIDQQTKPYYEAWVNTTLAAISKNSRNNRQFYEKQREFLLSFQKAFEEPRTPELVYENFTDEKYTGRIKITQR
ncbi:uncharacterized protein LOC110381644 [Helicoverpa armigera]|uniref:uncharacterized protein LOC110381644 n=1 Tax=Helicoverpa armigera TaxID=29058 RepID=UPI0030835E3A